MARTRPAVIFDVDGVLVDSYPAYRRIWNRWAKSCRLDPEYVWQHTHGRRAVETITLTAPALNPEAEVMRLREYAAEEVDAFPVYPDAFGTLQLVTGRRWGIVTSSVAATVRRRLAAGALPIPDVLIDAADVRHGKPAPEGYLIAAERLAVRPAACLVVEDTPAGVDAARAAGMTVVGVCTTHPEAALHAAHLIVDRLADARGYIARWFARS